MRSLAVIIILSLSFLRVLSAPNKISFNITPEGKFEVSVIGVYKIDDPSIRRPFVQGIMDFTEIYRIIFGYVSYELGCTVNQVSEIISSSEGNIHKTKSSNTDYFILPKIELVNKYILSKEENRESNETQSVLDEAVRIITVEPLIDCVRDGVKSLCAEYGIEFDEVRFKEAFDMAVKLEPELDLY